MLYISELFVIPLLSSMAGGHLVSPPPVLMESLSLSIIHLTVCLVASPIRHNELHDVTANLLSQVCSNVQIEPHLQPLSGQTLAHCTDDQARLDISANYMILEYITSTSPFQCESFQSPGKESF